MSNIGTASRIYDQSSALNFCKKTFSKEYYRKVISQFNKLIGITVLGIVIFGVVFMVIFLQMPVFKYLYLYSYKLYGHYDNGRIRYVDNDIKYIDMEDLGLDPSEFELGDDFLMMFDRDGAIIKVVSKAQYDRANNIVGTMLIVSIHVFVIIGIIWGFAGRNVFPEYARYLKWWHTIGSGLCYNCGRRCSTPEQCIQGNTVK